MTNQRPCLYSRLALSLRPPLNESRGPILSAMPRAATCSFDRGTNESSLALRDKARTRRPACVFLRCRELSRTYCCSPWAVYEAIDSDGSLWGALCTTIVHLGLIHGLIDYILSSIFLCMIFHVRAVSGAHLMSHTPVCLCLSALLKTARYTRLYTLGYVCGQIQLWVPFCMVH